MRKAALILSFLLALPTLLTAQKGDAQTADTMRAVSNISGAEMADAMRAEGKIYVVVLVLTVIFAGIAWYLVRLDRKIKKLENNQS